MVPSQVLAPMDVIIPVGHLVLEHSHRISEHRDQQLHSSTGNNFIFFILCTILGYASDKRFQMVAGFHLRMATAYPLQQPFELMDLMQLML